MLPVTQDMEKWLKERFLPRYEMGDSIYHGANVGASPLHNVREAIDELADTAFYLRQVELMLGGDGVPDKTIYVAGPYSDDIDERKQENIAAAMDVGAELYRRGYAPFIPHSMTADFEILYPDIPREVYLSTDLLWVSLCANMFMLDCWEDSPGAQTERNLALILERPIYYSIEDVPWLKHKTSREEEPK